MLHQLNMRASVALLRNPEAERRAKELAEAPTVKTEEQLKKEAAHINRHDDQVTVSERLEA
jgi:hypothetical protein